MLPPLAIQRSVAPDRMVRNANTGTTTRNPRLRSPAITGPAAGPASAIVGRRKNDVKRKVPTQKIAERMWINRRRIIIGGLVDWWIGGLVDWWIGGLVDWWIGRP